MQVATARWIKCGDAKKLEEFREKNALNLAVDAAGHLVYLAPSRVNLQLAQERALGGFMATREHARPSRSEGRPGPAWPHSGGDVALQVVEFLPLVLDHRLHQVADRQHADHSSPSSTGRWRMRCSVITCMQRSAVSAGDTLHHARVADVGDRRVER